MKITNSVIVLLLAFFQGLIAQSGTVDFSFGTNGVVTKFIGVKDEVQETKVQKDRKILVLSSIKDTEDSDIVLTRYLPDGSIDVDFGENGVVRTTLNFSDMASFDGIFFQLDQKIKCISA